MGSMPLAAFRIVVGSIFVGIGLLAALAFEATSRNFAIWHVPVPALTVPFLSATAIVCGGLLAFGALTRPVAMLLATIAVGAFATAGRYGGAPYAIVSPVLFAACVFFAWRSGRVGGSVPPRPPGVQ